MYYGNRQGGSVSTFIVVGLVLVALACGVLYGARQYMTSQRIAPISEESMQTAPSDKDSDKPDTDNSTENNSENQTNLSNESTENSEKSTDDTANTDETADSQNSSQNSSDETTTDDQNEVATTDDSDAPLPQTGPTTDVLAALTLGITAMVAVAYIRSQRMI